MYSTKKLAYTLLASIIFIIHFILVLIVTFGWIFPELFYPFVILLVLTVLSELVLGACVLSIWEFGLRKKINPSKHYDTSCIMHYGRGIFGLKPRVKDNLPKTFIRKNSFLIILALLLIFGSMYQYIMF